jgi:hypothetical protein
MPHCRTHRRCRRKPREPQAAANNVAAKRSTQRAWLTAPNLIDGATFLIAHRRFYKVNARAACFISARPMSFCTHVCDSPGAGRACLVAEAWGLGTVLTNYVGGGQMCEDTTMIFLKLPTEEVSAQLHASTCSRHTCE